MADDDIFSQLGDDDKTVLGQGGGDKTILKPMPSGRRPASTAMPPPQMSEIPVNLHKALDQTDRNVIVSLAKPLLSLLNRLSQTHQHNDVKGLYNRTIQEIRNFEAMCQQKGVPQQQMLIARYLLCSAIDEMVLNTPWGSTSFWPSKSLLMTFHKEATGGQKFFTILERLQQNPGANIDLLELIAICLALGFQGKYRVVDGGLNYLETIRTQLHQQIAMVRGEYERELSPAVSPIEIKRPMDRDVPLWVVGAVTGAIILSTYAGFNLALNKSAEPILQAINQINPIEEQIADQ